jgi:hypothetical protein
MLRKEIDELKMIYITVALERAFEEMAEVAARTEGEREAARQLEEKVRIEAKARYRKHRGDAATDEEFRLVWLNIRDDLMREVRALEAMRRKKQS